MDDNTKQMCDELRIHPLCILLALDTPGTASEILTRVREISHGTVALGSYALYTALYELMAHGLVAEAPAHGTHPRYELTPTGTAVRTEMCERMAMIASADSAKEAMRA
jgi:DNA-binding PadR family transcriptional regulator